MVNSWEEWGGTHLLTRAAKQRKRSKWASKGCSIAAHMQRYAAINGGYAATVVVLVAR